MADMSLPFKLLSQPSPDTSGAIAADTRKLASGEALQRLKTSGLMDIQKQKGADQLRTTLAPLGLDPNSPNFTNDLSSLFGSLQGARHAGTVGDASRGGVRITSKDPIDISQALPMMTPGQPLPATLSNPSLYREKAKIVNKRIKVIGKDGKATYLDVPFQSTETKETEQKVKAPNLPSAKQEVTGTAGGSTYKEKGAKKKFDPQSIPSSGLPFVHPNGQAGTIYNVGGKILFAPNPS